MRRNYGHLVVGVLVVLALQLQAHTDYVVASRHALVKVDPQRDAPALRSLERGDKLQLASESQQDGYYEVKLEGGDTGWVYRTFVRRYAGDLSELPVVGDETTAAEGSLAGADGSPYAYASIPHSTSPDVAITVLPKPYFTVGYSEQHRDPLWVCYRVGKAVDFKAYPTKRFVTDKDTQARVSHDDYTGSGYSRGHMAPRFAISSRFGKAGNDSTFIMSNICPQFQSYNDGQWGNLEEWVAGRKLSGSKFIKGWADVYETVWVTVGPIFDKDREPLETDVQVPNAFYCIVVDEEQGTPRAIAFILEHGDQRDAILKDAIKTVRQVEERTGLDFFSKLPDDIEQQLETMQAQDLWPLPQNPN